MKNLDMSNQKNETNSDKLLYIYILFFLKFEVDFLKSYNFRKS